MKHPPLPQLGLLVILVSWLAVGERAGAEVHRRRACLYRCIPAWDYARDRARDRTGE